MYINSNGLPLFAKTQQKCVIDILALNCNDIMFKVLPDTSHRLFSSHTPESIHFPLERQWIFRHSYTCILSVHNFTDGYKTHSLHSIIIDIDQKQLKSRRKESSQRKGDTQSHSNIIIDCCVVCCCIYMHKLHQRLGKLSIPF